MKLLVDKKNQMKRRKRKCRSLRTSESNLLAHFDEHKKRNETKPKEIRARCETRNFKD